MPTEVTVAETDEGKLVLRGNELLVLDKTSGDPCATRFRTSNETAGKICADIFIDGAWREYGYLSVKQDERGRTDPAHRYAPEFEFWGHKPNAGWNDADYERLFAIRHDGVVFYKGSTQTDKMVSNNGRFITVQQGDGNFVTYDLRYGPEGDPNAAIWSAWGGKIKDPAP